MSLRLFVFAIFAGSSFYSAWAACPNNCKTCNNLDECTECSPDFFLESANACKSCNEINAACVKCSATSKVCTKCGNAFLNKLDGTCVASCPTPSTYTIGTKEEGGECLACSNSISFCNECSPDGKACSKCEANKFLRLSDKKCYASCQPNLEFAQGDASLQTGICYPCSDSDVKNCYKCSSKSSCQECLVGFFTTNPTVITSCQSCSSANEGCSECTYKSSKAVCSKCSKGYYFDDKNSVCVKCSDKCLNCNKDRCLECEKGNYPLSPLYKACSPCSDIQTQVILSVDFQDTLIDICSFYPQITKTPLSPVLTVYNDMQAVRISGTCVEPSDNTLSSLITVYWACGKNNVTLNALTLDNIKSKVGLNASLSISGPDYSDAEGRFFGKSDNGTVICPGWNGGFYWLLYFCENVEGLTSARSADNEINYTLLQKQRDESVLIINSGRYSHSTKINNFLCCFEDLMEIKNKRLILTEQKDFCVRNSFNKRFLSLKYGLIFILKQDQYNISSANDLTKSVEDRISKGNFSSVLRNCNESIDNPEEIKILRASFSNMSLVPAFEQTSSLKYVVSEYNASFSLKITNINAIVWVGYAKTAVGVIPPPDISSLKTSMLENVFPMAAVKGETINVLLTDLVENSEYVIYFAAEDFFYKNATSIYTSNFKTLEQKFGSLLEFSWRFGLFAGLVFLCILLD